MLPGVQAIRADLAGKITGMLLEMDNSELLLLLESPEALEAKVEEAIDVRPQLQYAEVPSANAVQLRALGCISSRI